MAESNSQNLSDQSGINGIGDPSLRAQEYRVLARKYRPQSFAQLIGQDALVRTITNAIAQNRIAHAFMLIGVRGVGKTTTARIIARSLNCIGLDGKGGATIDPCGICSPCQSILAERNMDVMEFDAASRTGVNDIREIIEGVHFKPTMSRYKIYIIDEVHMLSGNAFNALLKTLEEPPAHTKFIFATTEQRKVPVTVLSRCQRFDLRRIEPAVLAAHFTRITELEGLAIEAEAAAMIARIADGSVRDGLSLLDQAIATALDATVVSGMKSETSHTSESSTPVEVSDSKTKIATKIATVTAAEVQAMLGLVERIQVYDLFDYLMQGDIAKALEFCSGLHRSGVDPLQTAQDLLEVTHLVTRAKVAQGDNFVSSSGAATETGAEPAILPSLAVYDSSEARRCHSLAAQLSIPILMRAWQLLLKSVQEIQVATNSRAALEMVLIRLAFLSDLPSPVDLVKKSLEASQIDAATARQAIKNQTSQTIQTAPTNSNDNNHIGYSPTGEGGRNTGTYGVGIMPQRVMAQPLAIGTAEQLITLFEQHREWTIALQLKTNCYILRLGEGELDIAVKPTASPKLRDELLRCLNKWTGNAWKISQVPADDSALARIGNQPLQTISESQTQSRQQKLQWASQLPLIKPFLQQFVGAEVSEVVPYRPAEKSVEAVLISDENLIDSYSQGEGYAEDSGLEGESPSLEGYNLEDSGDS